MYPEDQVSHLRHCRHVGRMILCCAEMPWVWGAVRQHLWPSPPPLGYQEWPPEYTPLLMEHKMILTAVGHPQFQGGDCWLNPTIHTFPSGSLVGTNKHRDLSQNGVKVISFINCSSWCIQTPHEPALVSLILIDLRCWDWNKEPDLVSLSQEARLPTMWEQAWEARKGGGSVLGNWGRMTPSTSVPTWPADISQSL